MSEYFQINYKSNPKGIGYILERTGDHIEILNANLSLPELKIEIENGNWIYSPIYNAPRKIDEKEAKKFASSKIKSIEKFLEQI